MVDYKNETAENITYVICGETKTVEPNETVNIPIGIGRRTVLTRVE